MVDFVDDTGTPYPVVWKHHEIVRVTSELLCRLLPGTLVPSSREEKEKWILWCELRLLYEYGGMVLPSSLVCDGSVEELESDGFMMVDTGIEGIPRLMGGIGRRHDERVKESVMHVENMSIATWKEWMDHRRYSTSPSSSSPSSSSLSFWRHILGKETRMWPSSHIGADVSVDVWMERSQPRPNYGIYVPLEVLRRRHISESRMYTGELLWSTHPFNTHNTQHTHSIATYSYTDDAYRSIHRVGKLTEEDSKYDRSRVWILSTSMSDTSDSRIVSEKIHRIPKVYVQIPLIQE